MTQYLTINRDEARLYGHLPALLLNRIGLFLAQKGRRTKICHGHRWVYATHKEFSENLEMSRNQVRRAITNLKKHGVISTHNFNDDKIDNTLWYSIISQEKKGALPW